jgi:hypothetical protein
MVMSSSRCGSTSNSDIDDMRSTLRLSGSTLLGSDGFRRDPRRRRARLGVLAVVMALALAAAYRLQDAPGPGEAIRGELLAAAGELSWQIVAEPTEPVRRAMRRHFREADVDVEIARSRANVLVTLRGLNRGDCAAAVRDARRIEGTVVVALESHRATADCGERNDMTWRIMP